MSNNSNHITYSAADIQRYLQGKLTPADMHAMEKAALDDPFLADAIEGMQQALQEHDETLVTGQLHELRKQLQTRTTKSKPARVIAFRRWQAAAAAVIVIAGALWIYNFSSDDKVLTVATQEKVPQTPIAPLTDENDATTANAAPAYRDSGNKDIAAVKPAPLVQEAAPSVSKHTVPRRKSQVNDLAKKKETMNAAKQNYSRHAFAKDSPATQQGFAAAKQPATAIVKNNNDFNNRETELITIAKNDSQSKPAALESKPGVDNKNLSGVVKGRVTDPFHNPIANAYVKLPNNANYNMLTDKTGYFKLPASQDSVVDVSVNAVGYGTQNFRLQNNASLNELQLQPDNVALNEVVVTGYGTKNKKAIVQTNYPKVMVQDAEPVYGWLAYEQYLEKNKQRPANYPEMTGNVVVSFMVNRKGNLSDFNIEQSLTKPYDEEAIRLITQGPAWKLVKGRKAKITVIVKF